MVSSVVDMLQKGITFLIKKQASFNILENCPSFTIILITNHNGTSVVTFSFSDKRHKKTHKKVKEQQNII